MIIVCKGSHFFCNDKENDYLFIFISLLFQRNEYTEG